MTSIDEIIKIGKGYAIVADSKGIYDKELVDVTIKSNKNENTFSIIKSDNNKTLFSTYYTNGRLNFCNNSNYYYIFKTKELALRQLYYKSKRKCMDDESSVFVYKKKFEDKLKDYQKSLEICKLVSNKLCKK
jgi:hypothetical protein